MNPKARTKLPFVPTSPTAARGSGDLWGDDKEVPSVTTQCTLLVALTGRDYAGSGKPRIAWEDPAAREETALVNDALALLAALDVEAS